MHDNVKEYYGKILQRSEDLKTNACCSDDTAMPSHMKKALANIHDEVASKYYGCGLVIPSELEGVTIVDLGSGSGRDCYALAQLVGENGKIIGVDMTEEQLEVARKHIEYHREVFGYKTANTVFHKGYIEKLKELDIKPESVDIIISNCVINLSPDKKAVFEGAYSLLKDGGEMYFSDVYADRRVPQNLVNDPELYGECLSGALYWKDFESITAEAGFVDVRLVESRPITIDNDAAKAKTGDIRFFSATYRLFKGENLEKTLENYGQKVKYRGTILNNESFFTLDEKNMFLTGEEVTVDGNTFEILKQSRFAKHFDFIGDKTTHYGTADTKTAGLPFNTKVAGSGG